MFQQAELNADTGDVQNVASISSAIAPNNLIEQNLKTVYQIYSSTWMQGIYSFTSSDSATLMNIAIQNPLPGGSGVYGARVMLDLPIDYFGTTNSERLANEGNSVGDSSSAIKIYPNPNNGAAHVEYMLPENSAGVLDVYSSTGMLMESLALPANSSKVDIDGST